MKLNLATNESFVGGVTQVSAFKVEMNAMMFHSVIDGIYADKIRSPFRELCTNARDGHAANGNLDEQFDVTLPSNLNPVFKVRDYGIGLSHDDVMGLYTTMFASSKRDSNDAVGMIGLGSKSPFAYTSAFTVTTWFDGVQSVYSAYIGEEGIPQIALMDQKASNQRGGVEISMPVKSEDIIKFRNVAQDVLFGFEPFPNVINEQWVRKPPVILYEGENWKFYEPDHNRVNKSVHFTTLMAKQGCVLYPINPASLGISAQETGIYAWPVVIDFPIGALDVSTSRESLGYTPKTIRNILEMVEIVKDNMARLLASQIDAAPTFLAACDILTKGMGTYGPQQQLWNGLAKNLRYKGQNLQAVFQYHQNLKDKWEMVIFNPKKIQMGVAKKSLGFHPKDKDLNYKIRTSPSDILNSMFVVEFPGVEYSTSRMRQIILDTTNKTIYWIRVANEEALKELMNDLGNPEWVNIKDYERLILKRDQVKTEIKRFRYLTAAKGMYYDYQAKYESRLPAKDMLVIRQEDKAFFLDDTTTPFLLNDTINWLVKCVNSGVIPEGTRVYLMNKSHKDIPATHYTTVKQYVLNFFHTVGLSDVAKLVNANSRNSKIATAKIFVELFKTVKGPKDLMNYMKLAAEETPVTNDNNTQLQVARLFCGEELDVATKQHDAVYRQFDELMIKYPVLLETNVIRKESLFKHYMELLLK